MELSTTWMKFWKNQFCFTKPNDLANSPLVTGYHGEGIPHSMTGAVMVRISRAGGMMVSRHMTSFVLFMFCVCVLIHIRTKGEVGAPSNRCKPSSKIVYWPFQGGTSFVDLWSFFLSCVCYVFVCVCLYVLCGHLLGNGWPVGSRLWCLTVSLLLSHWYPGSDVVLDYIDSWSMHPYFYS